MAVCIGGQETLEPLGQALMGKREGDVVEYQVPSGATLKVEVVEVGA